MPANKPIDNDLRFSSAGASTVGESVVTPPDNQLLAGYLAHEYLTRGTLFGNRFRTTGADETRPAKKPRLERRGKHPPAEENPDGEKQKVYVEVARLLREEGLHLPGGSCFDGSPWTTKVVEEWCQWRLRYQDSLVRAMNVKKKGVLKYLSQIFEEEDEREIQIGLPTDVKHVAHIGWDGPSAAPPSWNGGYQSAPLDGCANAQNSREDEDKAHATDGRERDLPGLRRLPKTSRRHVSMDSISLSTESPVGSPTSKNSGGGRRRKDKTSSANDAPNKSRKKKTKPSGKRGKRRGSLQDGAITSTSGLAALEDE